MMAYGDRTLIRVTVLSLWQQLGLPDENCHHVVGHL